MIPDQPSPADDEYTFQKWRERRLKEDDEPDNYGHPSELESEE